MHGIAFLRSNNFKLDKWRRFEGVHYHVISQIDADETDTFASYRRVDAIDNDPELGAYLDHLIEQHDIRFAIGHSEYDLVKSAQLRERLNLRGQTEVSANAYRDKHLMKSYCAAKGVNVAKCALVEDRQALMAALKDIGLPCVVKPVAGGGSRNTFKVTSMDDKNLEGLVYPQLVEQFIEGDMYHVDGIVDNGEVAFAVVSRYTTSCLAYQDGVYLGSTMVDFNSEIDLRMKAQTTKTVDALPYVEKMAFHAEFFLTPDNDIYLCEIAARSGGALVPQAIIEAFGVDINEQWIKQMQGAAADIDADIKPDQHAGWFVIPPKKAKLLQTPQQLPPFDWISHYKMNGEAGKVYDGPASSVCNVAVGVVTADNMAGVEARLETVRLWLEEHLEWES